jgi:NADH-quinone oxidoreductase subunit G
LHPVSWPEALEAMRSAIKKAKPAGLGAILGDQLDAESIFAVKTLMDKLGSPNLDCRQDGAKLDGKRRASYLFNSTIAGIDAADALLIIGSNPRLEAPVMNARIRRRWLDSDIKIAHIGPQMDLTYPSEWLGDEAELVTKIAEGSHPFAKILQQAERPMLILGSGALRRADGAVLLGKARQIAEQTGMVSKGWNGFNVLHNAASRVAGLDIGAVPGKGGKTVQDMLTAARKGDLKLLWLLGADELDLAGLDKCFTVYQGHHGDAGAHAADLVLPAAAWTEKNGLYVNFEGRVQEGRRAIFPPGEAREDWAIIRALAELLGVNLGFDSHDELRQMLCASHPQFADLDEVSPAKWAKFGSTARLKGGAVAAGLTEFYMSCAISRASETMAACRKAAGQADTAQAAE